MNTYVIGIAPQISAHKILRDDRRAAESGREIIFELVGHALDGPLNVKRLYGYALRGGNPRLSRCARTSSWARSTRAAPLPTQRHPDQSDQGGVQTR